MTTSPINSQKVHETPSAKQGIMLSMLDDEVVVEENQDTNIENTETLSIENSLGQASTHEGPCYPQRWTAC